jgi:hypothetical protein
VSHASSISGQPVPLAIVFEPNIRSWQPIYTTARNPGRWKQFSTVNSETDSSVPVNISFRLVKIICTVFHRFLLTASLLCYLFTLPLFYSFLFTYFLLYSFLFSFPLLYSLLITFSLLHFFS